MSQLTYSEQIVQTVTELLHLERKATQALVRDCLRFLRLLKEGTAILVEAGEAVSFKKSWCYELWKKYRQNGITGLSSYPFKGRQPWLKPQQQAAFKQSLSDDSIATLAQVAERIKEQTGIQYSISGTWVALKAMGIKKKTGRPCSVHHDEVAATALKKSTCPDCFLWQAWVLTSSGGLNLASGNPLQSLRFVNYSTKNGLRSDCLYSCIEDGQGNLWIGTQNGISRFSPGTGKFWNFDRFDGLSDINPTEASVTKMRNGTILFGTLKGYLSFNPEAVGTEKIGGAIVLTDVQVNNHDFVPANGNYGATGINYVDKLVLEHYQNNISFIYMVLDYRYEDKIQYQFRLLEYDADWQDNRRLRRVTYTNLDPGEYIFEVRGVP